MERCLPADSLLPGQTPAHDARCACCEAGHVDTDLREDDLSVALFDVRDGFEEHPGCLERDHRVLYASIEPLDRCGQVVDVSNDLSDHRAVMVVEPAGHTLAKITDLGARLAFGHLGQQIRVTFTITQGVEDQPAGHAEHIGRDR